MLESSLKLFNELAEVCGNRYLAIKYLSHQSRDLGHQSKGKVTESKLISWALTGEQPYSNQELERRKVLDIDIAELEDYLCYVDDKEVANQVRKYYQLSVRSKHVVLDTSQSLDLYRQMRVNVILRMIWYGLPEYQGGDMTKVKLDELKYVGEVTQEVDTDTEILETSQTYEFEDADAQAEENEISEDNTDDVETKNVQVEESEVPAGEVAAPIEEKAEVGVFKVRNCKIYAAPTLNIPARSFTGNVEVIGRVDNFKIVKYVRPGFGVVTGYTLDKLN